MGCATSKQSKSRCRQCQAPYGNAPMTRRSFSMNVHHPPVSKGDTYHVVALTSSTLGSIKLDEPPFDHKKGEKQCEQKNDHDHHHHDDDEGNGRNDKEFEMGVIEAKAWSKMIDEKITRVGPRTPIRTPPGEPETINVNDLMEGLEDTSPLRFGEHHLRSFSFHVSTDSIPSLIDSPRVMPQDNVKESPKKTWFDAPEKENLLANGNVVSKALVSEFDPEVISAFRKALEELSPSNPFHLKPRDRDQLQQVVMSGVLDEDTDNDTDNGVGVKAVEVTETTANGFTNIELIDDKNVSGDGIEEEQNINGFVASNGHAHAIGFVDNLDKKDFGSVVENGFAHTDGYLDTVEEDEVEKDVANVVENGHVYKTKERVVLYFTSLRGVRKTYEDCCYVRLVLKGLGVRVDERDVSMHSGFKEELKELLGEGFKGGLPKVFVGERFIGGVEEIRRMHEEGKLEKVVGECEKLDDDSGNLIDVCEACGDVRFMPCETCSGSCKIYYECEEENEEYEEDEYGFQRCPDCNENGLVRCPICCY